MASPKTARCATAGSWAKAKNIGAASDEAGFSKVFDKDDLHSHEVFVKHTAEGEQAHVGIARGLNPQLDKFLNTVQNFYKLADEHVAQFAQDPTSIMGEAYTKEILDAKYKARQQYRAGNLTKQQYNQLLKQPLSNARAKIDSLPPELQYRAKVWLDDMASGEDLFGRFLADGTPAKKNIIQQATSNAIGNMFTNNPAVAIYNIMEYLPKATVWAIQNTDDPAGVLMRSMSRYINDAQAAGGLHRRIPALEKLGIYEDAPTGGLSKRMYDRFGVGDVIDLTENPLRGLAYYLGEEGGKGGQKAVEDIAFVYRPGNEPEFMRGYTNKAATMLMRFSVGSMQMYGGLMANALKGDKKAMTALFMFHALTAAQTGAASSIPTPLWLAMPDDMKEQAKELKGLSSLLGIDVSENVQPFGGVAFGLGYNIATNDLKALSKIPNALADGIQDGDWAKAAYDGGLGVLMAGQLGNYPGVNMNTVKFYKVVGRAWLDNEAHLGHISEELMKEWKLKSE